MSSPFKNYFKAANTKTNWNSPKLPTVKFDFARTVKFDFARTVKFGFACQGFHFFGASIFLFIDFKIEKR